ncbi:hypothetical protein GCM10009733_087170 [Nonomuraea maheshkhaliensis]|uniref:Transketolase signature 1 domain-containing protein n=1 Tax=Nonomuraea maheshkhaliensis TaxID=419590 RepID=A0ABN2GU20_9ACTN
MSVLSSISGPADLKGLSTARLDRLAAEIRGFLIGAVSRTGGHLGPHLGVVELAIALHRVYDSPVDRIVFDVGHQAYVHKLLTGRQDFSRLRREGGLSGYPSGMSPRTTSWRTSTPPRPSAGHTGWPMPTA